MKVNEGDEMEKKVKKYQIQSGRGYSILESPAISNPSREVGYLASKAIFLWLEYYRDSFKNGLLVQTC